MPEYWYDFERCRGKTTCGERCKNRPRVPIEWPNWLQVFNTCHLHADQEDAVKHRLQRVLRDRAMLHRN